MCKYCDIDSGECEVFIDPLSRDWYLDVRTNEWDSYDDDFICERVYGIKYCPYCGQELNNMRVISERLE